jgi:hypothetical protein
MFNWHHVDNFDTGLESKAILMPEQAERIAEFLKRNLHDSNDGTYSPAILERIANTFTQDWIAQQAQQGYLVYATDETETVVGSGMIVRHNGVLKGRYWNVDMKYRSSLLAGTILRNLGKKLVEMNADEIYFGAFKFPKTLNLYRRLGCEELPQDPALGTEFEGQFVLMRLRLGAAHAALKK